MLYVSILTFPIYFYLSKESILHGRISHLEAIHV